MAGVLAANCSWLARPLRSGLGAELLWSGWRGTGEQKESSLVFLCDSSDDALVNRPSGSSVGVVRCRLAFGPDRPKSCRSMDRIRPNEGPESTNLGAFRPNWGQVRLNFARRLPKFGHMCSNAELGQAWTECDQKWTDFGQLRVVGRIRQNLW